MEIFGEVPKTQKVTKGVFVIVDRPTQKSMWIRVGSAWENRDGSLRVLLNALPVGGELHIRDPKPLDEPRPVAVAS